MEWGRDYSEDLELAKSSESKEASKPQMSEAKKLHDDLMKRIAEFYASRNTFPGGVELKKLWREGPRKNQRALITENKHEVKKLKSIVPNLRILRDLPKQKEFAKVKPSEN